jgi:trehalose synthase
MFVEGPAHTKSIDAYTRLAGRSAVERCQQAARDLKGARVLHINTTTFGGGVAELLFTIVPLMRDLGLDASWALFPGSDEFFAITKAVHNGLQGMDVAWTAKMQKTFLEHTREAAKAFEGDYDFVIVHDPQPAALLQALRDSGRAPKGKWIWRCHIDLTASAPKVWDFFAPFVQAHDAAIFTLQDFVKPLEIPIRIIPPSIDPLSPKNSPMRTATQVETVERYGVDPNRPLLLQVSRFDPWKDPLGVIDTYRLVREHVPALQLAMIASMAHDDPEGIDYLRLTEEKRGGDPGVHLLSNLQGVGNVEVNAFQRQAGVVIQKSVREGFGLVVSEAMWKSKAVVGGRAGGIALQIDDGINGFLVSSVEEAAERVRLLFEDTARAARMGKSARAKVRQNFLSPRQVADYLELMGDLT